MTNEKVIDSLNSRCLLLLKILINNILLINLIQIFGLNIQISYFAVLELINPTMYFRIACFLNLFPDELVFNQLPALINHIDFDQFVDSLFRVCYFWQFFPILVLGLLYLSNPLFQMRKLNLIKCGADSSTLAMSTDDDVFDF